MHFSHFCTGLVSTSLIRFMKSNIDIDKSLKGGEEFSPPPGGPHSRVPQNFVLFPTLGECGEYVLSMQLLPWHNVLRNCRGNNFFKRSKIYPLIYPPSWAYCCILAYTSLSPTATAHSHWLGSLECLTRRPVQNTILTANDIVREFRGLAPVSQPYLLDITWEIPGKWL